MVAGHRSGMVAAHHSGCAPAAMISKTLKVDEKLAKGGTPVEIVNPGKWIPLDEDTILSSVEKTNRVIIAEEAICAADRPRISRRSSRTSVFDFLDAPPKRITASDVPIPLSPPLEKVAVPDEARIEAAPARS